jgi:hypothetical protein
LICVIVLAISDKAPPREGGQPFTTACFTTAGHSHGPENPKLVYVTHLSGTSGAAGICANDFVHRLLGFRFQAPAPPEAAAHLHSSAVLYPCCLRLTRHNSLFTGLLINRQQTLACCMRLRTSTQFPCRW